MATRAPEQTRSDLVVRALTERDLPQAGRIFRLAFGTFMRVPDPENFWTDRDYVQARWRADPSAVFAAEADGELVGASFATNWGSVGVFGPLVVRPDFWDRGVGKRLLEPAMARFDAWGMRHVGLFTFADSAKHIGLYQRFGFWPRALTAIMVRPVGAAAPAARWSRFSVLSDAARAEALRACRDVADAVHEGLDLSVEIRNTHALALGDTVLLEGDSGLAGFAVCHCGPASEAGEGTCLVKFGAVRPGARAERDFGRLLDACDALAAAQGASTLMAGVNTARDAAYRMMMARGFRAAILGVAMHRPNEAAYHRPDSYVIDDWR